MDYRCGKREGGGSWKEAQAPDLVTRWVVMPLRERKLEADRRVGPRGAGWGVLGQRQEEKQPFS